jgi:hypothetical protein
MKVSLIKNFQKMSQGLPNPCLRLAKVQKEDFLKKPSPDLNSLSILGLYESLERLEG